METSRFDRLTRAFAGGTTRRRLVGALGFGTAATLTAGSGPALATNFVVVADTSSEEAAVSLYEALASMAETHTESCPELGAKLDQFKLDHAEQLAEMQIEQEAWSHDQRIAHVDIYGDRLRAASKTIIEAGQRCSYIRDDHGTPIATPAGAGGSSCGDRSHTRGFLALAAQESCDCDSTCPISTWHCIESGAGCAGGDSCECCMTSLCGHTHHCLNNCNANGCCETPCNSYSPPQA